MHIDEVAVSRGIVDSYWRELSACLDVDVVIAGGGPSGLVAGYFLARERFKTVILDRNLAPGGGMWGGGMMFNKIVVQEAGKRLLDHFEIRSCSHAGGYYIADSIEAAAALIHKAVQAGVKLFNLVGAEDLMVHNGRVCGVVLNWSPVAAARLHVDPLVMRARCVVDSTGHPAELLQALTGKMGVKLNTSTGGVSGEKSMNASLGEADVIENTREVYPGIYVTGMAANAAFGGHRMGPIFGGMLLSGEKAAREIAAALRKPAK